MSDELRNIEAWFDAAAAHIRQFSEQDFEAFRAGRYEDSSGAVPYELWERAQDAYQRQLLTDEVLDGEAGKDTYHSGLATERERAIEIIASYHPKGKGKFRSYFEACLLWAVGLFVLLLLVLSWHG